MNTLRRWIPYDTIKLIVALLLLALMVWLSLSEGAPPQISFTQPPSLAAAATTNPAPTGSAGLASPMPTYTLITFTTVEATLAPTRAAAPSSTASPQPTLAPTRAAGLSATPAPEIAATASLAAGCQPPSESRLAIGMTVKILSNLNLRSEPEIADNILSVNTTGTLLKVLQGPVCVPYQDSAYLWWQVESPAGMTGWSVENNLNGRAYYLEPVP